MYHLDTFTMVLLAKSVKNGKYCLAGIDPTREYPQHPLIRLIANDPITHNTIDESFFDGEVNPLDIVSISYSIPYPGRIQTENYLLHMPQCIKSIGSVDQSFIASELKHIYDTRFFQNYIFLDNREYMSSYEVYQNRISHSLEIHYVTDIEVFQRDYVDIHTPKHKVNFNLNGIHFSNMPMTDPRFYDTRSRINRACILVSIAERPIETSVGKKYYKYVSGIHPY